MSKPHANHGHEAHHGSYMAYVIGFVLSIVLTLVAYFAVVNDWFSGTAALLFVTALAVVQLLVQLLFFLHLGEERSPRWNLMTFVFAAMVVFIVVIGSIWIMYNLNYNMVHDMTPKEIDQSIIEDEGIQTNDNAAHDDMDMSGGAHNH